MSGRAGRILRTLLEVALINLKIIYHEKYDGTFFLMLLTDVMDRKREKSK